MTGPLVITETIGTSTSTGGTLTLKHNDAGGKSSIVFPSTFNPGSDYGYIEYRDNYNTGNNENSALIIGVENDATGSTIEDKIYFKLNSSDRMVISGNGNVGIGTTAPSEKLEVNGNSSLRGVLTVTKNATNSSNNINVTSTQTIEIKSGNPLYEVYTLTYNGLGSTFRLPYLTQSDTTLVNKTIAFKISGSTQVFLTSLLLTGSFTTIKVDGVNYVSTTLTKSSSFILRGTATVGEYTTHPYEDYSNTDQLTIRSNWDTSANSEFTGIRFLNTNTDSGFIRVEIDREHTNATMQFYVRSSGALYLPLEMNSYITAHQPIIRKSWTSGELIQTKIYNQNTSGSGVLQVNAGLAVWKTINFTTLNNPTASILVVEVFAPYAVSGGADDETFITIDDTTSVQQIVKTGQRWNNLSGGGTRSGTMLPIMGSYTPSTTTKSRTITIYFENSTNDDLYICRIYDGNGNLTDQNNYTIKISEYKI
jgi:hypothetical protein